jgi:hypothetical protein
MEKTGEKGSIIAPEERVKRYALRKGQEKPLEIPLDPLLCREERRRRL